MKFYGMFLSLVCATLAVILVSCDSGGPAEKVSVLLIDGQNNHAWAQTTPIMVDVLESSGRFDVTVSTAPPAPPRAPRAPKEKTPEANAKYAEAMKKWEAESAKIRESSAVLWEQWNPDFSSYDVVVSNYNGEPWPGAVQRAFEEYVSGGGGFVPVHAANNAFPSWKAYNEMIALGGWGGRSELSGPYLRLRDGNWIQDTTPGRGGSHGKQHEFVIEVQKPEHPIVKGLPASWLHAQDELYDRLRGPAENVEVLAASKASEETGGSGEYEPLLMAIQHGEGRVFHTTLGHGTTAMTAVGFQETLKRGTEWAATGKVTFPAVSAEELTLDKAAVRELAAVSE